MIDRLHNAGAKAIAYDVQFSEPTTRRDDNALILAARRARSVVLSTTEVCAAGANAPQPATDRGGRRGLRARAPAPGTPWSTPTRTGSRAPSSDSLTGFASRPSRRPPARRRRARLARRRRRGVGRLPRAAAHDPHRPVLPRSAGEGLPRKSFATRRSSSSPTAPTAGRQAASLREGQMPGAEIQANAIWTVASGFPLGESPGLNVLLICGLSSSRRWRGCARPLAAFLVALGVGLAYAVAAQLFNGARSPPAVHRRAGRGADRRRPVRRDRARMGRDTFARFVPESVVDDVMQRTGDDLRLGGVRREETVLSPASRSASFERLEPDQGSRSSTTSPGRDEHDPRPRRHLVAYMGDGIMAVFGA